MHEASHLLQTAGDGPPEPFRYRQDAAISRLFESTQSCIECFAFAAHLTGSLARGRSFRVREKVLRNVHLNGVARGFLIDWPGELLSSELDRLARSKRFARLTLFRNVTSHRGIPPRSFYLSVGADSDRPPEWNAPKLRTSRAFPLELDEATLSDWFTWLSDQLSVLVPAHCAFCESHLPGKGTI